MAQSHCINNRQISNPFLFVQYIDFYMRIYHLLCHILHYIIIVIIMELSIQKKVYMGYPIDFSNATSEQIEKALSERIQKIRLSRNIPREVLAREAGVSLRTIARLEEGLGVTFDTMIRVMIALRLQDHLSALLPDPSIQPIAYLEMKGKERKKARAKKQKTSEPWTWNEKEIKNG